MAQHSKKSASAAHRWIHCPGSIRLSEKCPAPEGSDYAKEGTFAHAVAELKLRIARDQIVGADELKQLTKDELWTGEMDEATNFYRDMVIEHLNAGGAGAELLIEQRVDYSQWVDGGFGTSDAVIISDGLIEIVDLKYGQGIRVDATDNEQMRLYALGAFEIFDGIYDFSRISMTIVQPRFNHISTEELSVEELLKWGDEVARPAAQLADKDDAPIVAGDWCRWCPAKAICRARAEKNLELARYDFADPDLLTEDEIAEIMRRGDELTKWAADVQEHALKQAIAGTQYDGFKLVEGRSNRKYSDELKVAEKLTEAGYKEAVIYERKLLGLTAMEKLVGKKKLTELLKDLIIKPAGKPTLVPNTDPREPINSAASAAADFSEKEESN